MEIKTIANIDFLNLSQNELDTLDLNDIARIKGYFITLATHKGDTSAIKSLKENHKSAHLTTENGITSLKDYICEFKSGAVYVNLGCCFFLLSEIEPAEYDFAWNFLNELNAPLCKAQPLIMQAYAKKLVIKKNEALNE